MMKRKTITKKLRFEIFKRDGFKCAYCGKEPPNTVLEIDHIEPVSKGGEDDINNYITACFDCNRGKSNVKLSKIPPQVIENLDTLREKEEQISEYRKFIKKIERREKKDIEDVAKVYSDYYKEWELTEKFKKRSVRMFLRQLPKHEVEDAMRLAIEKFPHYCDEDTTKYFCGICWRRIKRDEINYKIRILWQNLSSKYQRGIGYLNEQDIEYIKDIPLETLEEYMIKALSERSSSYWKEFMSLLENDGLF